MPTRATEWLTCARRLAMACGLLSAVLGLAPPASGGSSQPSAAELARKFIVLRLNLAKSDDPNGSRAASGRNALSGDLAVAAKALAAAGPDALAEFTAQIESLDLDRRSLFLRDADWPFRTDESYQYLLRMFERSKPSEQALLAALLAARGYQPAVDDIRREYTRARAEGKAAVPLAVALIRLGQAEPLLDLLGLLKRSKDPAVLEAFIDPQQTGRDLLKVCVGPLADRYLAGKLPGRDRLAIALARRFDVGVEANVPAEFCVAAVDHWLAGDAGKVTRYDSYVFLAALATEHVWDQLACDFYDRALAVLPGSEVALLGKAQTLIRLAKPGEATTLLEVLVRDKPGCYAGWHYLASMYLAQKKYSDAIYAAQKAVQLDPRSTYALNLLKRAYTATGEPDKAAEIDQRLAQLVARRNATTSPSEPRP